MVQKNLYIETYGCQMNVADSEVVASVMNGAGYRIISDMKSADLILINTCSIRENAEQKVFGRLREMKALRKKNPMVMIGVIGCMAERLRETLFDMGLPVDIVAGPDAYRSLPDLLAEAEPGQNRVNVILSDEETYSDIKPVRPDDNGVTAFISIMRGCNNFCSYCVVPYVRGSERSRDPDSVIKEASGLFSAGYREVTLIGQNVNSWKKEKEDWASGFPELLHRVALISPLLRVRFSTSHPKDLSDELLHVMASSENICRHIHLPVQSGSSRILNLMNRQYTREWYLGRTEAIRKIIPECAVSTDIIAGFCTETEEDHQQTLSLMEMAGFDFAYMFKYNQRPGTGAASNLHDDVSEEVKTRRLNEIISLQNRLSAESKKADIGKVHIVLAEGVSRRSAGNLFGRNSQNKVVVFPKGDAKKGDYLKVIIRKASSATLIGETV